jgi:glycosyltransferase involved in cell wall biosynthesis
MTPRISVVVPVKNRVEYLGSALLSLINQTFTEWEAIIVDDGSTDDIAAEVARFKDGRFRYVHNEGDSGVSGARNFGNKLAQAPIICVFDSDDICLPRRLEVTVKAMEADPSIGVFYGNLYNWNEHGYDEMSKGLTDIRSWKHFAPFDRALMFERDIVSHGVSAYRKAHLQDVQYDPTLTSAEDYDFFLNLVERNVQFAWTEEPLLLYRRHNDQTGSTPERKATWSANIAEVKRRHPGP